MPGMTVVEVPATKPASPSDGAVPEVVRGWTTTGPLSSRPFATTVAWFERFPDPAALSPPMPVTAVAGLGGLGVGWALGMVGLGCLLVGCGVGVWGGIGWWLGNVDGGFEYWVQGRIGK